MGFGWILIAVVMGLLLTLPHRLNPHWRWGPIKAGGVQWFGEEFDFPVSASSEAANAKRLVLDNLRGNITLNGGDGTAIRLEGHKVIRAFERSAAEAINRQADVTFTRDGDTIFIRSTEPPNPEQARMSTDLEIGVPRGMSIEARGRSGDLSVNTIQGGVDISTQHGEIRLGDIGGEAKIDVEHCDLVRASNVKGNVDVHGSGRDIQVDNIDGQVSINGSFSGTLEFHDLEKPLHFGSGQTDLRVERLPGNISMSLSELRGTNLVGPVKFITHQRDVHFDDFSGPVSIELERGDIDLKPNHEVQLARVDVRSRNGNIEMALPGNGHFDLKATAQKGDVSNDFGDGVVSESSGEHSNTLKSANPNGPQITLSTDRGEISVRKLE